MKHSLDLKTTENSTCYTLISSHLVSAENMPSISLPHTARTHTGFHLKTFHFSQSLPMILLLLLSLWKKERRNTPIASHSLNR